ncbi:MAG: hypothetical protein AAGA20_15250 [Planctomycetota bacterium]
MDAPIPENVDADPAASLHAARPKRLRTGALAAAGAILVVVGVTAVPEGSDAPPVAAGATPLAIHMLRELPADGALPALDLGDGLGGFTLPGRPTWDDYADGSASLDVWFRATEIPDAVLAGEVRFARRVEVGADGSPQLIEGGGSGSFHDGRAYAYVGGTLHGRGGLEGVTLHLTTFEGEIVRRGSWTPDEGESVLDVVHGTFLWTSEGESVRNFPVPERGRGTLTAMLRPRLGE